MKQISFFCLFTFMFVFHTLSQNIMISSKHAPNEPSIAIDPSRPWMLVAGANLNNVYVSYDTGHTWHENALRSSYGVWGDPAIIADTFGNFYFFHLSNPASGHFVDRIVCQKTNGSDTLWSDGSFTGLNGEKVQDKQWAIFDRKNNHIYVTWTQFDKYGSKNPLDSSIILFSKSSDGGQTWSSPIRINRQAGDCRDSSNTVEGAVPAVGPDGEIYVVWAGPQGIVFNRSDDTGNTWLKQEIRVDPMPGGWDYSIPGIYRCNGMPVTVCDVSNSPYRGTIYINWSDQRNGKSNTDVWLAKSTDGGYTWSAPLKVNDDASGRQQFFTWMTIDQATGYLYFVFYDRRNHAGDSTDVYVAVSRDGGKTFINYRVSDNPFLPDSNVFFGDYTNITAYQGIIRPIWTRLNNGRLSIWTDLTRLDDILHQSVRNKNIPDEFSFENYPNPTDNIINISYNLHSVSTVTLEICDLQGKVIIRITDNEKKGYGKYLEQIDLSKYHIPAGAYLLKLMIDNNVKVNRQIVVK